MARKAMAGCGSVLTYSREKRRASGPLSRPKKNSPRLTSGPTGWSANSNDVTTPKLPPPPRSAQKISGFSSFDARVGGHHLGGDEGVAGQPGRLGEPAHAFAET